MKRLVCVAVVATLGALAGAGCGASDGDALDPIGAQQAAESMVAAARQGDSDRACKYLSRLGKVRYQSAQDGDPCATALDGSILSTYTYEVDDLTVSPDGGQAAVRVHNDDEQSHFPFLLEPENGKWRVSMIGIQNEGATDRVLQLVKKGGFDPEKHADLYSTTPGAENAEDPSDALDEILDEETPADEDQAETYLDVGEGGKDDGLGFKVLSLEEVDSIPPADEYSSTIYAPPNGKLVAAEVEMTNYGKTSMDPFCGSSGAVLLDLAERNYELDTEAMLEMGAPFCDGGVAPGFTEQVTLPFKVPTRFKMGALILWNSDSADSDGEESELIVEP